MATREAELFKEKIEVSLDGRQVFCLFCGGAVIACLVFVLGVTIGRRVEARVHPDEVGAAAANDPLAALDQLAATDLSGGRDLAFGDALREQGDGPLAPVDVEIQAEALRKEQVALKDSAGSEAPKDAVAKPAVAEAKPEAAAKPEARSARFTLQLSSFQDKAEADAFVARLSRAGHPAHVIEANVEDKGLWYRVRLGRYTSYDDAIAAKASFEAGQGVIAYVTRL